MTLQPSLVLLQKTLLNIEGLGRQLYPQLDLWETAKPFLEQWLKDRYHPKALLSEIRRHGPDWLERFPEVPDLLFEVADQFRQIGRVVPTLHRAVDALAEQPRRERRDRRRRWIGTGVLIVGGLLAWAEGITSLPSIPLASWLFFAGGVYWFLA